VLASVLVTANVRRIRPGVTVDVLACDARESRARIRCTDRRAAGLNVKRISTSESLVGR
jgi:hypothetical protein